MSQPPEPRVLVVDDEPNIVDVVTMALRFQGFAVRRRPLRRRPHRSSQVMAAVEAVGTPTGVDGLYDLQGLADELRSL